MNGRPYRPRGTILPTAPHETSFVRWSRRNRSWLPLWAALAAFLVFAVLMAVAP